MTVIALVFTRCVVSALAVIFAVKTIWHNYPFLLAISKQAMKTPNHAPKVKPTVAPMIKSIRPPHISNGTSPLCSVASGALPINSTLSTITNVNL